MATSPAGNWSEATDKVRTTFAAVAAYQTWTNTTTSAAAKSRIYFPSLPRSGLVWPFLTIHWQGFNFRDTTGGFDVGMRMICHFECKNIERAGTPDEAYYLMNSVGAILVGVEELAGVANPGDYISHPAFSWMSGPTWTNEGERAAEGDIMYTDWLLSWGFS